MSELLEQLASVAASGRPAALATLVAAAGATPKKAGSTMWVSEDGTPLGSVTIGGCVDTRVIERAERVIATGRPELLRMTLGDEDAWELGLTCGGEVDVLVQRVDPSSAEDPGVKAYAAARVAYEAGRASMVVARLDEGRERLAVDESGATTGTLGDDVLDRHATDVALRRLASAQPGIERRGVRYVIEAEQRRPATRRRQPALIKVLDAAIRSGEWTWTWQGDRLAFAPRRGPRR